MRTIVKGPEPRELTEYRAREINYDGPNFTPVKAAIRSALLQEQGHLCAYCMRRIADGHMKVEHWRSQQKYPLAQLSYSNLLGCCDGHEGSRRGAQTCDTHKGNTDLTINPSNPAHHARLRVRYLGNGIVEADDIALSTDIAVLNLNHTRLQEDRKGIVNAVKRALGQKKGARTEGELRRLLVSRTARDADGRLPQYCGVIEYLLLKRLRRT